jgi:16S rRNA (uracil1498-N3)-methyltransferase
MASPVIAVANLSFVIGVSIMYRFYIPPPQISDNTIEIGDPERHHILNVLRLKSGNEVQILDGAGNSYIVVLGDTRGSFINASIRQHQFHPPTPPHITLFQGLPKSDKMDLIVQKTTELGVDQIVPMLCQRSVPKRTATAHEKHRERWQRIANEGAKQCKRHRFPKIRDARKMSNCLEMALDLDLSILFWEQEAARGIKEILSHHQQVTSVGLFIGPEGGFSGEEVATAIEHSCIPTTLGDLILRTETAAIVSVALVRYELLGT